MPHPKIPPEPPELDLKVVSVDRFPAVDFDAIVGEYPPDELAVNAVTVTSLPD